MTKFFTFTSILVLVVSCATLTSVQSSDDDTYTPKNLKILPQTIQKDELEAIMKSFNASLGVKCSFCHAAKKSGEGLDFASDEKFEKIISRGMMEMTKKINEDFFDKHPHEGMVNQISCTTCHNGQEKPFTYQRKLEE